MLLKITNYIIKYSIYSLVFLMPLLWLPITSEIYEFNKQYLLFFLAGLAFLAWLVKMIVCQKKFVFKQTRIDLLILIFVIVMIVSAIFSIDSFSSWFGLYGRFTDALVGLLAMIVMYFVIINNLKNSEKILQWFLASIVLVVIISCLSVFGFLAKISVSEGRSFNPVATTLEGLAVFLAASMGFIVSFILISFLTNSFKQAKTKPAGKIKNIKTAWSNLLWLFSLRITKKVLYIVLLLADIILLIKIDFWAAWLVLGIAMVIFLAMAFWIRAFKSRINLLIVPILLLVISIAGIFVNADVEKSKNPLPKEVILDYKTTRQITWSAIKENPLFGSGPGTFLYDFAKFKPVEFNSDSFWNIKFDKGPSHLLELVSTTGGLGIISYLSIIVVFLIACFTTLKRKEFLSSNLSALVLFTAWSGFFVAQCVYLQNTPLALCFWLFTGLGIAVCRKAETIKTKKIEFSFEKLPEISLVLTTLLLFLILVVLGLFFLGSRFYLAEAQQAKVQNSETLTFENKIELLQKSISFNKYRSNYRMNLASVYLNEAKTEVDKIREGKRLTAGGQTDVQFLSKYALEAIEQAKKASEISPNLIIPWEALGTVYLELKNIVAGADGWAIRSFEQAIELEPNNPFFHRELCNLYLITGQEKDWSKILEHCQKAVDLKPNYLDAYIQLALAYERKDDTEAGIKKLEAALIKLKGVRLEPGSQLTNVVAEIYFHLGRLHYNADRPDKAIESFEQAILLVPQHSNAHYGLGVVYQSQGMISEALKEFETVAEFNPGNEEVERKIDELTEGDD